MSNVLKYLSLASLAIVVSCSSSTSDIDKKVNVITKTIQIPIKESNSSFRIAWYNDQSYLVFDPDRFIVYRITGSKIDTLPVKSSITPSKTNYYEGIVQTEFGYPALVSEYDGVYIISDTVTSYPLPSGSLPGVHGVSITKAGVIYAWGIGGAWPTDVGSKVLDQNTPLFGYNTRGLYFDDSIGIMLRTNTVIFFKGKSITKQLTFNELGAQENSSVGYVNDWIGKMNGMYYLYQDGIGIKINPSTNAISSFKAPSNEIVSFTDGDCFFSKRMDLAIWCDDGKKIATLTSQNSDVGDEMIYAGKNSDGHWISNGRKLILLDLNKAKAHARK